MIIKFLEDLLHWNEEEEVLDAEYEPFRDQLSLAGLSEEELRKMDPDDRVAALEQANLDPYDLIYGFLQNGGNRSHDGREPGHQGATGCGKSGGILQFPRRYLL